MRRLTTLDAQMLHIETATSHNHVAAVYTYDPSTAPGGQVSFDDALATIASRVSLSRSFRERLVRVPYNLDNPYWINDPDFDLEFHVRHVGLARPGDWNQLCTLIARLHAHPLDMSRPPWEFYFIDGLDNIPHLPSGSFATFLKMHHAAVDGTAGLEMATVLHDFEPDPAPLDAPKDSWTPDAAPGSRWLLRQALTHNLKSPVRVVRAARTVLPAAARVTGGVRRHDLTVPGGDAPQTRFNGAVSRHRAFECRRFSLHSVKLIRAAVPGATLNDAIIAIVGGALRRYLESKNELPDTSLVSIMPISVRAVDPGSNAGNQFQMMPVTVGTDLADPLERLAAVRASTTSAKAFASALGARTMIELSEALPGALFGLVARYMAGNAGNVANMTVTNIPGPQKPLYFSGAQAIDVFGTGPTPDGSGLIHLVGSYNGDLFCSVVADREMLPDPAFYAQCLEQSFADLLSAAGGDPAAEEGSWP